MGQAEVDEGKHSGYQRGLWESRHPSADKGETKVEDDAETDEVLSWWPQEAVDRGSPLEEDNMDMWQ